MICQETEKENGTTQGNRQLARKYADTDYSVTNTESVFCPRAASSDGRFSEKSLRIPGAVGWISCQNSSAPLNRQ